MSANSNQRINKILQRPPQEDRLLILERQIHSLCSYFDQENNSIKEEIEILKEVIFNRVLTPNDASVALQIKASAVRKNLELGLLQGYKDGGRWKTTLKQLFEFMSSKPNKYGSELTLMDVAQFYQ